MKTMITSGKPHGGQIGSRQRGGQKILGIGMTFLLETIAIPARSHHLRQTHMITLCEKVEEMILYGGNRPKCGMPKMMNARGMKNLCIAMVIIIRKAVVRPNRARVVGGVGKAIFHMLDFLG